MPPVEISSTPKAWSCFAKGTRPSLLVTLRSARWTVAIKIYFCSRARCITERTVGLEVFWVGLEMDGGGLRNELVGNGSVGGRIRAAWTFRTFNGNRICLKLKRLIRVGTRAAVGLVGGAEAESFGFLAHQQYGLFPGGTRLVLLLVELVLSS